MGRTGGWRGAHAAAGRQQMGGTLAIMGACRNNGPTPQHTASYEQQPRGTASLQALCNHNQAAATLLACVPPTSRGLISSTLTLGEPMGIAARPPPVPPATAGSSQGGRCGSRAMPGRRWNWVMPACQPVVTAPPPEPEGDISCGCC